MKENKTIQHLSNLWHKQTAHSFAQLADYVRETHLLAQETAVRAEMRGDEICDSVAEIQI